MPRFIFSFIFLFIKLLLFSQYSIKTIEGNYVFQENNEVNRAFEVELLNLYFEDSIFLVRGDKKEGIARKTPTNFIIHWFDKVIWNQDDFYSKEIGIVGKTIRVKNQGKFGMYNFNINEIVVPCELDTVQLDTVWRNNAGVYLLKFIKDNRMKVIEHSRYYNLEHYQELPWATEIKSVGGFGNNWSVLLTKENGKLGAYAHHFNADYSGKVVNFLPAEYDSIHPYFNDYSLDLPTIVAFKNGKASAIQFGDISHFINDSDFFDSREILSGYSNITPVRANFHTYFIVEQKGKKGLVQMYLLDSTGNDFARNQDVLYSPGYSMEDREPIIEAFFGVKGYSPNGWNYKEVLPVKFDDIFLQDDIFLMQVGNRCQNYIDVSFQTESYVNPKKLLYNCDEEVVYLSSPQYYSICAQFGTIKKIEFAKNENYTGFYLAQIETPKKSFLFCDAIDSLKGIWEIEVDSLMHLNHGVYLIWKNGFGGILMPDDFFAIDDGEGVYDIFQKDRAVKSISLDSIAFFLSPECEVKNISNNGITITDSINGLEVIYSIRFQNGYQEFYYYRLSSSKLSTEELEGILNPLDSPEEIRQAIYADWMKKD